MTSGLEQTLNEMREWDYHVKKTPVAVLGILELCEKELGESGFYLDLTHRYLDIRKPRTGSISLWEKGDVYIRLEKPDTDMETLIEAVVHNLHIKTEWGPAKVEFQDNVVGSRIATEGLMSMTGIYLHSPKIKKGHMLGYEYSQEVNSLKSIITLVAE